MKLTRHLVHACLVLPALPAFAAAVATDGPWLLSPGNTSYATKAACVAAVPQVNGNYGCSTTTTIVVTGVTPPAPPPAQEPSGGAVTYSTTFDTAQTVLSEGGRWHRANNPWTDVRVANGMAFGTNGTRNSYDDSYALLSGFGPNQTVEATVQRGSVGSQTHEVELLLRMSDDTNNVRGYEALFNKDGGFEIVRWNGPFGSFTPLSFQGATGYLGRSLQTGDVVKASAIGSTITIYINGVFMAKAVDSTFATGQPGIGFFTRPGGNSANLGLSSFKASSN